MMAVGSKYARLEFTKADSLVCMDSQLNYFDNIIACGIQDEDKSITSLSRLTGQKLNMDEIKARLYSHYSEVFDF